jgi:diketogulonate reductase-like aldo/keto reductase
MLIKGIPAIGFGTWPLSGGEARACVSTALEVGYRHIDTAQLYGNEADVGAAVATSRLLRGEVFVTTKVDPGNFSESRFLPSVCESLDKLRLAQVDLLLIHWPPLTGPSIEEVIDRLNGAAEAGYARLIGISNFTIAMVERAVLRSARPLANNQIEFHPLLDQSKLKAACAKHGFALSAYCPLARGAVFGNSVIAAIAEARGRSEAAVVLRWIIQQGVVALPMTTKRANAIGNLEALSFSLTEEEMARISALTKAHRRVVSPGEMRSLWDS